MQATSQSIFDELTSRAIDVQPVELSTGGTLLAFHYKGRLRTISGAAPDLSTATSRTICNDKNATKVVADLLGVKTPVTAIFESKRQAETFLAQYGKVVVKPINGAHGSGVTTNIISLTDLHQSIERARQLFGGGVLLQQQVTGSDYRVLVVGGKMAACAERVPAKVVGDGASTIELLIERENATNPRRGLNYEKPMNVIDVVRARAYLGETIESIPTAGEEVTVVGTANIGTGGEAIDRTHDTPAVIIEAAEKLTREIGAFVCGVDFMYDETAGAWHLIELNSSPSFGLHSSPSYGDGIDVAKLFVDRLLEAYEQ